MADFPTRQDLFRVARDTALSKNALLSAEAIARDGTDANILVAAGSAMGDKVIGQLVLVASGCFLDSALGQALDRLVFDRYGLIRKPAAPAMVNVGFTVAVAAVTSFSIPAGTVLSSSLGNQFVTLVATSILAGQTGPVYVPARSILAGADQQVKIGDITAVVSSITGAPAAGVIVSNTAASAGAADREQDDALRDRARRFWVTAQRGTLAAIETGALSVPGVVRAAAIEVTDGSLRPGRWVLCMISDAFTEALSLLNATSPSYQSQSQALSTTVFQTLDEFRCGGIYVQVIVAQVVLMQFELSLTFSAGVDTLATANAARAAIGNYVNSLDPGQSFQPSTALTRLRQVAGLIITGSEIVTPVGPVVPRVLQVLRTRSELLNASSSGLPISSTINPDSLVVSP